MIPLPDGRAVLRWMFLALGLILLCCHEFVVQHVLRAEHWAHVLFAHKRAHYAQFVTAAYFYLIPTPLLCLAAGFALKRNNRWARWTGAAASSLLLFGFPVLTIAGVIGLYALFAKPRPDDARSQLAPHPPVKTSDLSTSKGDSKAQPFIFGITMLFGFQALALFTLYAQHNGMPVWNPGRTWWMYAILFLFVQSALHELGHAAMAWTVYHRVRLICLGPFTFWNDGYGYQFRFDWKRLVQADGYSGAVPTSDEDLFVKEVAIIAAGPLMSLVTGGLFLLVFLSLSGTQWQASWWVVAINAVLGLCYAAMSLVPLGSSDGAMLYHLLLDTPDGRWLFNRHKVAAAHEKANAAHCRADFEKEVEFRQAALELVQEGGEQNAMAIALSHQALGHARLAFEDWPGAQAEFLKCLAFEAECTLNPPLAVNSWAGLQKACVERHWVIEAGRAGAAAVQVIAERKPTRNRTSMAVTKTLLAQVHLRAGAFDAALAEATEALAILPPGRDRLRVRSLLRTIQAMAHLYLGAEEQGLSAAREAAANLCSAESPKSIRNLALDELGALAEEMWKAGESSLSIELMHQAVKDLESAGAAVTAAQYRIKLAAVLRTLGRYAEALYTLPDEETLPPGPRRSLLAGRAELHLAAGRHREAIADCRELVALWQALPDESAPEIAVAEGLLARACLEAGDPGEAAPLARRAAEVLAPWGHPDAAGCRITMALATRERSRAVFDDALRLIESDPLLSAAEKTRMVEVERARIERYGPVEGTAAWEVSVPSAVA